MKTRAVVLAVILVLLFTGAVALGQSDGSESTTLYAVEPSVASGAGYRLTTLDGSIGVSASGGRYRLLTPSSPSLRGSGCCCIYLPCVLRQ